MAFSDQYCDLHGYDPAKPYFTAHDQSNCSIIRVHGCETIVSEAELMEGLTRAAQQLGSMLRTPHHSVTITFERSRNNLEQVQSYRAMMERRTSSKGLNASQIIDEITGVLKERLVYEEILIACWTAPGAGFSEEIARERRQARETWGQLSAKGAMDPLVSLVNLEGPHIAFVQGVLAALATAKVKAELLQPRQATGRDQADAVRREDLAAVRRALLFHETPADWQPQTTFDRSSFELRPYASKDISPLFAPPLSQQIMTSNAKASADMRQIAFGGRTYAVVHASMFPRQMPPFRLLASKLERYDGRGDEDMPWRYALHLLGGVKINAITDVLNTLISFLGPANNNKRLAVDGIRALVEKDEETFVGAKLLALTWIEPNENPELLSQRRSRLVRALESWNSPTIVEASINPMRALTETAAGMTRVAKTGRASMAPITELAMSLPFHRTAQIYSTGQSIMISPEGKPMPIRAHAPEQNFWLTLIQAPPGSGKSVYMNRVNTEFVCFTPGAQLPFVGTIDVGPSSMGFIELVRNMAPLELRHQVLYHRLRNDRYDKTNFINPLDLGLGNRKPLERERIFIEAFVSELLSGDGKRPSRDLVAALVRETFKVLSDLDINSTPKRWQEGLDPQIDMICRENDITLRETTKWWAIVDQLTKKNLHHKAGIAQRYASPLIEDLARIVMREDFVSDYGLETCKEASLRIQGAIEQFPIFSRPTALDIGEARVMSIDLNEVIIKGEAMDAGVARHNTLMFMIASNLFLRQISGNEEDIGSMSFPEEMRSAYLRYWYRRFQSISETPKRFGMDEFHRTDGTPSIVSVVEVMAREGRKWGLEVVLASQKLADFSKFTELASTIILLDATTKMAREQMRQIFGFSPEVQNQIADHLHGPRPNMGSSFIIGAKLKTSYVWARAYNHLAPTLLWALDTTPANRNLRNALVRKLGLERALRLLVSRFPRGTAVDYVESFTGADQTVEDDSLYVTIASQLVKDAVDLPAPAVA